MTVHFQNNQAWMSLGCIPITQILTKEPQISLSKFDGTHSKFNYVHLVIQLHPHHYIDGPAHVGFIGTLLLGITLA
jgi:hypothetical protein